MNNHLSPLLTLLCAIYHLDRIPHVMCGVVHWIQTMETNGSGTSFHGELVEGFFTLEDPQALVLARNHCAQDLSWIDGCTGQVIDPILNHHEAKVLAVVIDIQDVFTSSPNHVLLDKEVIDGLR